MSLSLSRYGVTLIRLTEADIEMVRKWRNTPDIQQFMVYRQHITEEMQQNWFSGINNKFNYYFLIEYDGRSVGVINSKKVDLKLRSGEGGIFLWEQGLWGTQVPSFATLVLLEFTFEKLKIFNKSFVQVLRSNTAAIKYNEALGYCELPYQAEKEHPWYILTREDYLEKAQRLRTGARLLSGDELELLVAGTPSDLNLDEINVLLSG